MAKLVLLHAELIFFSMSIDYVQCMCHWSVPHRLSYSVNRPFNCCNKTWPLEQLMQSQYQSINAAASAAAAAAAAAPTDPPFRLCRVYTLNIFGATKGLRRPQI